MLDRGGRFLPAGEQPEARPHLCEMTEGKQVSGIYWLRPSEMIPGFCAMGLEFSTSETLLIMAGPVLDLRYMVRLFFRWIPAQQQWTRTMGRIYGQGLDRATADDFLKKQIQGQVVRYIYPQREPRPDGGEEFRIEFRSGDQAYVVALPSDRPFCADLDLQLVRRGRSYVGA